MTIHEEIEAELARAIAKFPDCESLPNGTDPLIYKAREVMARRNCEQAYRAGVVTHAHIFEEEAMEVLAEEDPGRLRVELIQCAAVILKWLKDLARKGVGAAYADTPPAGVPMCPLNHSVPGRADSENVRIDRTVIGADGHASVYFTLPDGRQLRVTIETDGGGCVTRDPHGKTPTYHEIEAPGLPVAVATDPVSDDEIPTVEEGYETCKRLGIDVSAWAADIRKRVAAVATGGEPVPQDIHERGWQWRPVGDGAFAPPFGTIRQCDGCGCLVAGGPSRCGRCVPVVAQTSMSPEAGDPTAEVSNSESSAAWRQPGVPVCLSTCGRPAWCTVGCASASKSLHPARSAPPGPVSVEAPAAYRCARECKCQCNLESCACSWKTTKHVAPASEPVSGADELAQTAPPAKATP